MSKNIFLREQIGYEIEQNINIYYRFEIHRFFFVFRLPAFNTSGRAKTSFSKKNNIDKLIGNNVTIEYVNFCQRSQRSILNNQNESITKHKNGSCNRIKKAEPEHWCRWRPCGHDVCATRPV